MQSISKRILNGLSQAAITQRTNINGTLTRRVDSYLSDLQRIKEDYADILYLKDSETDTKAKSFCDVELAKLITSENSLYDRFTVDLFPLLINECVDLEIIKPSYSAKGALVQIRAGSGGDEASLFAESMFQMYQKVCQLKQWRSSIVEYSPLAHKTIVGNAAMRSALLQVEPMNEYSDSPFEFFLLENGDHRVKRVPATENKGRVHTSFVNVATLPLLDKEQFLLRPEDLVIDTFKASGSGGQHVNTTDSAVRITHVPTGIFAAIQTSRSQHENKSKAMLVLESRVKMHLEGKSKNEQKQAQRDIYEMFSNNGGKPSRTYHYGQNYIADHRVGIQYKAGNPIEDTLGGLLLVDEINPQLRILLFEKRADLLLEDLIGKDDGSKR